MNKFIKLIVSILSLLLIAFLVFVKHNFSFFLITGNSMFPTYTIGDLVILSPNKTNLKIGDAITYRYKNSPSIIVTHRISEVKEGGSLFLTKGDNNEYFDYPPVHVNEVIGKVSFSISNFSKVLNPKLLGFLMYFPLGIGLGISIHKLLILVMKKK